MKVSVTLTITVSKEERSEDLISTGMPPGRSLHMLENSDGVQSLPYH